MNDQKTLGSLADELIERSKDDRAIIVGSEIRAVVSGLLNRVGTLTEILEDFAVWSTNVKLSGNFWVSRQGCDICGVRSGPGELLVHDPDCVLESLNE